MIKVIRGFVAAVSLIITSFAAFAQESAASSVSAGDTAWMLISTALVMLMTIPGLALFYGGLVRKKNTLSIFMQCFILMCVMSLLWVVAGYSLSFSPSNSFIGNMKWAFLNGVGAEPYADYAGTIPHSLFMLFQMMFAVITPALIIGAFAERMKFTGFLTFMVLWSFLVYFPVCHWVWAIGGWLRQMGALDFAGGTVVHINAGIAALVAAIVLGKRKGYNNKSTPPHNLPFTVIGAALLWFGWFGFNAGSALSANGLAVNAFMVTHIAAASAGLSWAIIEWIIVGKPTILGTATGAVAGLVAITPAAGFVNAASAIAIGLLVSVFCYIAVAYIKPFFGYDDSLDAFGVHGIGGIWGAIATGIFATKSVNPAGADGLLYGNPKLLLIQIAAVAITLIYSGILSFVILKIVRSFVGVRASEKDEAFGLDLSEHHEGAYTMLE